MTPSCCPSSSTTRTCGTRIIWLMRRSRLMVVSLCSEWVRIRGATGHAGRARPPREDSTGVRRAATNGGPGGDRTALLARLPFWRAASRQVAPRGGRLRGRRGGCAACAGGDRTLRGANGATRVAGSSPSTPGGTRRRRLGPTGGPFHTASDSTRWARLGGRPVRRAVARGFRRSNLVPVGARPTGGGRPRPSDGHRPSSTCRDRRPREHYGSQPPHSRGAIHAALGAGADVPTRLGPQPRHSCFRPAGTSVEPGFRSPLGGS